MQEISDKSSSAIREIFGTDKVLIGMIHCPAFPGAPRYRGAGVAAIYDACMRDAEALVEGGMHGLIIENHGDIPFSKPEDIGHETAAFMAVVADRIARAVGVPLGINVLANAPIPAFAIAMAGGAKFIRVNQWANAYVANEGFMEGRAAEAMRYRSLLRAEHVRVFADSHVKHGSHAIVADRSIEELTRDLAFFDASRWFGRDEGQCRRNSETHQRRDRRLLAEAGRGVVEPGRYRSRACLARRGGRGSGGVRRCRRGRFPSKCSTKTRPYTRQW
jgi:predicted TIM-barrel enzyme